METKKINANSLVRTDLQTAQRWNFLRAALTCVHDEVHTEYCLWFLPTEREAAAEGGWRVFQLSEIAAEEEAGSGRRRS